MNFNELLKNITKKNINIGIVGMGYVGLPLAKSFVQKGAKVYGFDIDKKKIDKLRIGKSYINYFKNNEIKEMIKKDFIPTTNFTFINKMDLIILCLPTPIKKNKSPEMLYILNSMRMIFLFKNISIKP